LSQKTDSLDWRPWLVKVGQKNARTPQLVTTPAENPNPKQKILFQSKLEDVPNPYMV